LKREEKTTGARQVRVFVPRHAGTDWADVWCQRRTESSAPMSASVPMPGVGEPVSE
jgi:putative DNA primase/helicase